MSIVTFAKMYGVWTFFYFPARTWRIPSISIPQCFLSMIEGLKVKGSCGGLLQGKKKKPEWAAIKLPLPPSVFSPPSDDKTRRASDGPGLEISRVRVGLIFTFLALLARLFWPKNAFTLRSGLCPTPSLPCAVVPPPPTAMEPSIRLPPPPFLLLFADDRIMKRGKSRNGGNIEWKVNPTVQEEKKWVKSKRGTQDQKKERVSASGKNYAEKKSY